MALKEVHEHQRGHRFRVPAEGVRLETGVTDGSVVSSYYDPMLAKLIVHAPTRSEAALRLSRILADSGRFPDLWRWPAAGDSRIL